MMKKHLLLANPELSKAYDYAVGKLSETLDSDHVDGVLGEFILEIEEYLSGSFETASRPLMQFMGTLHPHHTAIVQTDRAELLEGQKSYVTDDFIRD